MTGPADATDRGRDGGFRVTGRMVLLTLVGFFAVVAGVNAFMVTSAVRTFGGVETENAYKAGLAFNASIAEASAQDGRHWQVEVRRRTPAGADFTVNVRDGNGRAVTGMTLEATLVHPTDRRRDRTLEVAALGAGAFQAFAEAQAGQWDLVIALRDGEASLFRSRNRIVLR